LSAEDDRTKETATVLNKVATAAYPAEGLAPWMSHYDKKTEAAIVGMKTIADIGEELDRQIWNRDHPDEPKDKLNGDGPLEEEEMFDTSRLTGAGYMFAFCCNALARNIHNYAPSVDGIRTKQAIALAKANNPGMATNAEEKKKSLWQKLTTMGQKDKSGT
jgi:hypothetical protein